MICQRCRDHIPNPQIYIKAEDGLFPMQQTPGSSGLDLVAAIDQVFFPGEMYKIPTGVTIQMPANFEGQLRSRSGLSSRGLVMVTGLSTIDQDYRYEILVPLMNATEASMFIERGDRIAQLVFQRLPSIDIVPTVYIPTDTVRTGGFGSTDE